MHRAAMVFTAFVLTLGIGFTIGAYVGVRYTTAWSETAQRQIRGELSESEARFAAADLARGKAESTLKTEAALLVKYRAELQAMRERTGLGGAVVSRASNVDLSIRGTITPEKPFVTRYAGDSGAAGTMPYEYRLSWFRFATADIRDVAVLPVLSFDLRARLRVIGYRDPDGALETETMVDLRLLDPDGNEVPLQIAVESYEFEYAPRGTPVPGWRDGFGLDAFAYVAAGYPFDPLLGRVAAGLDLRLWVLDVLAWGEAEMIGLQDDMGRYEVRTGIRGMVGIGGRWGLL